MSLLELPAVGGSLHVSTAALTLHESYEWNQAVKPYQKWHAM